MVGHGWVGPPRKKNKSLDLDAAWLLSSWWLNQPIWKICSSNWMISPRFGFKIKNVWNHHLAIVDTSENKIGWRKFTIKNVWSFTTHLFSSPQFLQRFFAYEILRQVDNGVLQGHLVMAAISAGRVIQPACTDTSPKVTSPTVFESTPAQNLLWTSHYEVIRIWWPVHLANCPFIFDNCWLIHRSKTSQQPVSPKWLEGLGGPTFLSTNPALMMGVIPEKIHPSGQIRIPIPETKSSHLQIDGWVGCIFLLGFPAIFRNKPHSA